MTNEHILQIEGLSVHFNSGKPSSLCALEDVSLSIGEGEVLGLVGESGSGKTVLSHAILGLLPGNGEIVGGSIRWKGKEIQNLPDKKLRPLRGREIGMIFQDPQASLNPIYKIGRQIEWVLNLHQGITGDTAKSEALKLLESVKLPDPERCAYGYAHQLSGGMAQRVMIALALAGRPKLLIADEATSALDVTTQAEIVSLLREIVSSHKMALLFVSHDLGLVSHICQRVVVLCRGKIAEEGETSKVLSQPQNEYTEKLISAARLHQLVA